MDHVTIPGRNDIPVRRPPCSQRPPLVSSSDFLSSIISLDLIFSNCTFQSHTVRRGSSIATTTCLLAYTMQQLGPPPSFTSRRQVLQRNVELPASSRLVIEANVGITCSYLAQDLRAESIYGARFGMGGSGLWTLMLEYLSLRTQIFDIVSV